MQNINKALDKAWEKKSLKEIAEAPVSAFSGLAERYHSHSVFENNLRLNHLVLEPVPLFNTARAFSKPLAPL